MNLKDVFQWVDTVMKSLHSAWDQSLEKGSRVRDRSWNLLLENDEHNFKYNIFIWSIIHSRLTKLKRKRESERERGERDKLRESSITNFPHVSITHLDTTLLFDFSWNEISDRGIILYITSHIPRGNVFK